MEAKPMRLPTASSGDLFTAVYDELRRVAAAQVARLSYTSTLQATALVHEAWLRLGGDEASDWRDQSHFVAAATEAMRHILIDRARRRRAVRHGGQQHRIDLDYVEVPAALHSDDQLLALDAALMKLGTQHPAAAALVKLQCFGGLDVGEAGRLLGLTRSAAYRRWQFARAWLQEELTSGL